MQTPLFHRYDYWSTGKRNGPVTVDIVPADFYRFSDLRDPFIGKLCAGDFDPGVEGFPIIGHLFFLTDEQRSVGLVQFDEGWASDKIPELDELVFQFGMLGQQARQKGRHPFIGGSHGPGFRIGDIGADCSILRFQKLAQGYRPFGVPGKGGDDMEGEPTEGCRCGLEIDRQMGVMEEMEDRVGGEGFRGEFKRSRVYLIHGRSPDGRVAPWKYSGEGDALAQWKSSRKVANLRPGPGAVPKWKSIQM